MNIETKLLIIIIVFAIVNKTISLIVEDIWRYFREK